MIGFGLSPSQFNISKERILCYGFVNFFTCIIYISIAIFITTCLFLLFSVIKYESHFIELYIKLYILDNIYKVVRNIIMFVKNIIIFICSTKITSCIFSYIIKITNIIKIIINYTFSYVIKIIISMCLIARFHIFRYIKSYNLCKNCKYNKCNSRKFIYAIRKLFYYNIFIIITIVVMFASIMYPYYLGSKNAKNFTNQMQNENKTFVCLKNYHEPIVVRTIICDNTQCAYLVHKKVVKDSHEATEKTVTIYSHEVIEKTVTDTNPVNTEAAAQQCAE